MGNLSGFDADNVESCMPKGEYPMIIVKSDVKPTKEGNGKVLVLDTQVVGGKYQNKEFRSWIVLQNKDGNKNDIGESVLASVCKTLGNSRPSDTSELHGKPFIGIVSVVQDQQGVDRNQLTGAKSRQTNMVADAFDNDAADIDASPF